MKDLKEHVYTVLEFIFVILEIKMKNIYNVYYFTLKIINQLH